METRAEANKQYSCGLDKAGIGHMSSGDQIVDGTEDTIQTFVAFGVTVTLGILEGIGEKIQRFINSSIRILSKRDKARLPPT